MDVFLGHSDVVTAYGPGLDALWNGLLSNQTAIAPTNRFAGRNFSSNLAATIPDLQVAPNQSRAWAMLQKLLTPLIGKLPPQTPLILATTVGEIEFLEHSILSSAGQSGAGAPTGIRRADTPSPTESAAPSSRTPLNAPAQLPINQLPISQSLSQPHHLLARIQSILHLTGPAFVLSSACASSSAAVTRAASMIRHHDAPSVLVVTVDSISEFVYAGFSSLASLAETPAKPFDAHRTGLTLGEAAAYVVLNGSPTGIPSTPAAQTSILGWGNTSDASHMTAPDPSGQGLARAIAKACAMAHRHPADISLIAAHGTATQYSDAMEIQAFRAALPNPTPTFSIKGAIGHTLAAAGLLQLLITQRALTLNLAPPTVGLTTPDASALNWAHPNTFPLSHPLVTSPPPSTIENRKSKIALSTNSGFGGVNTAILLGGPP